MELTNIFKLNNSLILWQIVVMSVFIIAVIAIVDIARNKFENSQKFIWLLICLFVPLGGLVYFVVGRRQRIRA